MAPLGVALTRHGADRTATVPKVRARMGPSAPVAVGRVSFDLQLSTPPWRTSIDRLRTVAAFLPLSGSPEILADRISGDPGLWLPDAEPLGGDRWVVEVHAAGWSQRVAVAVGDPWSSASTLWRSVSWEPIRDEEVGERGLRHLPVFDGELGVFAAGAGASLALEGRYLPPGGSVGAVLDGLALHRVARSTVNRFMEQVAASLNVDAVDDRVGPDAG